MIQFEVLNEDNSEGSASVRRFIHNPEISDLTVKKMVSRLGLSGLVGFDFILEERTGRPHLIELNARATQTCHLRLGERDATLRRCVAFENFGQSHSEAIRAPPRTEVIALFPQEEWIKRS